MKKNTVVAFFSALALLAAPLCLSAHEGAETAKGQDVTLKGEILDMACYAHGASGEKHAECAKSCVKGGTPMGLKTKEGQVYLLVPNHGAAKPYEDLKAKAGEQAEVSGDLVKDNGVQMVVVESFK